MEKDWYKSKAIWGAIVLFVAGGLQASGYTQYATLLTGLGAALGLAGIRTAMK